MPGETRRGRGTIVMAPFSPEQVLALNLFQFQSQRYWHPFTCAVTHEGRYGLVATLHGWVCLECDYTQDWAHAYMATWCTGLRQRVAVAPAGRCG